MNRKILCITLALILCLLAVTPTFADAKPNEEMRSTIRFTAGHSQRNDGSTYFYGMIQRSSSASMTITVNLKNSSGTIVSSASNVKTGTTILAGNSAFLSSGTYTIEITGTINGSPVSDPSPTEFTI